MAVVATVAVVGVLLSLGGFSKSSGPGSSDGDSGIDLPTDDHANVFAVVEEFAAAWNDGDAVAAVAVISDDWEAIQLPGVTDGWLSPADGRPALSETIAFLTATTELSLGTCDANLSPPEATTTAVVRCRDAAFRGDYLDAVTTNIWGNLRPAPTGADDEPGLTFEIRGDRITALSGRGDLFAPQAYCIWAEADRPDLATVLFDLHCRPIVDASAGSVHAEVAAAFVAEGSPLPPRAAADARLAAGYVDRFFASHNIGDIESAANWLALDVTASDLPGFPVSAIEPALFEYLAWSSTLFRIDTGACMVAAGAGETLVTCEDLRISGVLHAEPAVVPTRFVVNSVSSGGPIAGVRGRILSMTVLEPVPTSLQEVCAELRASAPAMANRAFAADCTPIYSRDAASAIATALGAFRSG